MTMIAMILGVIIGIALGIIIMSLEPELDWDDDD